MGNSTREKWNLGEEAINKLPFDRTAMFAAFSAGPTYKYQAADYLCLRPMPWRNKLVNEIMVRETSLLYPWKISYRFYQSDS